MVSSLLDTVLLDRTDVIIRLELANKTWILNTHLVVLPLIENYVRQAVATSFYPSYTHFRITKISLICKLVSYMNN